MRYVFKRFGEALEIIVRPERYVRLDEDLARDLDALVQQASGNRSTSPRRKGIGNQIAARQLAVDILRFGMTYQWTVERNMRAWEQLTPREQEIAALVCLGYANGEIGQRLVISTSTVKSHVRNVLQKFGVNGKLELKGVLNNWDFSNWDSQVE